MNRKLTILRLINKLPDDVTYARVIYHLDVMNAIEEGEEQIERGQVIEHEQLFAELLAEDEKAQNRMVPSGQNRSKKHSSLHRSKRSPNRGNVRKETQRSSR